MALGQTVLASRQNFEVCVYVTLLSSRLLSPSDGVSHGYQGLDAKVLFQPRGRERGEFIDPAFRRSQVRGRFGSHAVGPNPQSRVRGPRRDAHAKVRMIYQVPHVQVEGVFPENVPKHLLRVQQAVGDGTFIHEVSHPDIDLQIGGELCGITDPYPDGIERKGEAYTEGCSVKAIHDIVGVPSGIVVWIFVCATDAVYCAATDTGHFLVSQNYLIWILQSTALVVNVTV